MRYWTRIGLVTFITFFSLIIVLIILNGSRIDLSNDEAASILQSADSSPKPVPVAAAPLGILIVITVISVVLVISGFVVIAMILDPSTSLVEEYSQEGPVVTHPFHV